MRTILIDVCDMPANITIGYRRENEVKQVAFDYSKWAEDFGEGILTLHFRRAKDSIAYPVVLSTENHIAIWTISRTDTRDNGWGEAQLEYVVDPADKMSAVLAVFCHDSLPEGADPPDPYESWISTLISLGAETQINALAAKASAEAADQSAKQAGDYAEAASKSEQNAETSASAAARSAHDAAASAADAWAAAGGYMVADVEDEHLIITITNCDQLGFSMVDERLVVTYG